MTLPTWKCASALFLLSAGTLLAKPPELPVKPSVDCQVPSPTTQEHFTTETSPPPLLRLADVKPAKQELPVAGTIGAALSSLLSPIELVSGTSQVVKSDQVRSTYESAEAHFKACDCAEANRLYREVVTLAPGSRLALLSAERLQRTKRPAETHEPPLALPVSDLQMQALLLAVTQYKAAVESGDASRIAECSKTLESTMKFVREATK